MHAFVTSYSGTELVVNVDTVEGSGGPFTAWTINVGGLISAQGALLEANNLSDVANPATALTNIGGVPTSRTISAGTGLTGGGDLTANRTLTVSYGTTAGTACEGNDARLSDARTPLSHFHAASDVTTGTFDNARINFAAPSSIGSTTPAAISGTTGTFTTLTATPSSGSALTLTGGTVTASAPLIDATQTWNNGAVTFTGLAATITNTASATSSLVARLTVGSTNVFEVDARGFTKVRKVSTSTEFVPVFEVLRGTTSVVRLRDDGDISGSAFAVGTGGNVIINTSGVGIQSTARFGISSSAAASTTDCDLHRDAADTFAQRRGINAQTFRLYGQITGTDVSATGNYERGYMRWSAAGGTFQIGTEKGSGGGAARALELSVDGTRRIFIDANLNAGVGSTTAFGGAVGLWVNVGANQVSIGASLHSVRTLSNSVQIFAQNSAGNATIPHMRCDSGLIRLFTDSATSASHPAFKNSGSTLQVRIANDSGFAPFTAGLITATGNLVLTDNDGPQTATFDAQSKLTANRTYDLPDASGTIALTSDIPKTLLIPASAWIPKTTAGCGVDSRETTTNDQNFDELLFDAGTDEFADALVVMPSNYNNGTVTARFYWTAASSSGTVEWAIQGRAFANDDALDTAAGTKQSVNDTLIAANDMHVTSATSACTIGGTPAANTPIQFTIYRDVSEDTLAVDARLLGVEILFN
jgi:hypothetical protein